MSRVNACPYDLLYAGRPGRDGNTGLTYMVWPGEPGMLEPGLEQILSEDDLVGCGQGEHRRPITR